MPLQTGAIQQPRRADYKNVDAIRQVSAPKVHKSNLAHRHTHHETFQRLHTLRCDCTWRATLFRARCRATPNYAALL